ncbi:MAG: hypothetical protein K2P51_01475 [Rhabdochlamydiaceae bacterium]|nr:hypothetical protein [Rhabdochlamydiaceae bacterium]
MSISNYKQLTFDASNYLTSVLNSTPQAAETIALKNFCATLQLSSTQNQALLRSAGINDPKCSEFGSTFFYAKDLHKAVDDLLSQSKALNNQERAVLVKWKESTQSALEIGGVFDYFRARLPCVVSNLIAGNNPTSSWITYLFGWFFLPSQSEYQTLAEGIVQKVQSLKCNERFLIPYGTMNHETLLCLEKDGHGAISAKLYDPNSSYIQFVNPDLSNRFTDPNWWVDILYAKLSTENVLDTGFEGLSHIDTQRRNTCFGHCHWSFLSTFLAQQMPSSKDAQEALARKIKVKIYEHCGHQNQNLMNCAQVHLKQNPNFNF